MVETLKNIAKVTAGNSAPIRDELSNDGIPFIRAGSLEFLVRGISIDECEKIDPLLATKKKMSLFSKGSILFAKSGMSSKMGRIYVLPEDAYVVSHLAVITITSENVNNDYVAFYFNYKPPYHLIKDDAYPSISIKDIENLEIPLPDLETQNKIVAILEKAKVILDKREDTIAKYDELLMATFLEMFGNPMERPNQWKINPINDCIKKITAGSSYGGEDKKELQDDELGVLKISAVTKGIFNPNEYKAVKRDIIKKKIVHPRKGDLLFSRANTLELVGATSIVDDDYEELFLPDKLWKIDTNETLIKKVYLHYVLQNKDVRKSFLSIATGSSGSMLNISMDKFRNINIPYPPIELQDDFEIKHNQIQNIIIKLRSFRNASEDLMKSLSHQVFSERITIDVDAELEALINTIDIEDLSWNGKRKFVNAFKKITEDITFIQRLVDRLDEQKIENQLQYNKAKSVVFRAMEKGRVIKQIYNDELKKVKLTIQ